MMSVLSLLSPETRGNARLAIPTSLSHCRGEQMGTKRVKGEKQRILFCGRERGGVLAPEIPH